MRIDAHQHFWRYDPAQYGWIGATMQPLKRDYLPDDLRPLLEQTGVSGTIAVQARQSEAETAWLLELADRHAWIKGVVGWVDLRSPDVREELERYARHPKLCGIRHIVHDEPDDRFMLRPDFLRGLGMLEAFNLTYDLLLFPKHLPVAVEVVKQFPQQRFVLDHLAKPAIRAGGFSPWDADIRALSRFENVACKLSGLVTEAAWQQWQPGDFQRYLDHVVDCFGPDRLMFGSDWPVCTLSGAYADVVRLIQDYIAALPADVQARIWGDNAARWYALA
ncbi:MAG TPA: amidohydrolase family protein [Herpetosiphonaceae bacterium]